MSFPFLERRHYGDGEENYSRDNSRGETRHLNLSAVLDSKRTTHSVVFLGRNLCLLANQGNYSPLCAEVEYLVVL